MPARLPASAFNPVSTVKDLFSIVREISLDDLRDAAERPLRVAVVGQTVEVARRIALDVFGPEAPTTVVTQSAETDWPYGADLVLVERGVKVNWKQVGNEKVVEFDRNDPAEHIQGEVVKVGDDMELALGRQFPALRKLAALHVVGVTSKVNGQFALASNVPAVVPVLGGALAAGADTIVLTKNQLMMLYKLAAVHGRNLDDRMAIYREMLPIVGAGLFWRTVARNLATMMPFAAGTIPKVTIAFAGTYASGMAAHTWYAEGVKLKGSKLAELYQTALDEMRKRPELLRGIADRTSRLVRRNGSDDVIEASYVSESSPPSP